MHNPDVISIARFPGSKAGERELPQGPELWPVSLWDAAWILAGVALARLLLLWA